MKQQLFLEIFKARLASALSTNDKDNIDYKASGVEDEMQDTFLRGYARDCYKLAKEIDDEVVSLEDIGYSIEEGAQ